MNPRPTLRLETPCAERRALPTVPSMWVVAGSGDGMEGGQRRFGLMGVALLVFLALHIPPPILAQEVSPQIAEPPDLYYLVVDISGSIIKNRLEQPIRDAVKTFQTQIPDGAELRAIFFDHERRESGRWVPMSSGSRRLFENWFATHFKPGKGDTMLFDTIAFVFAQIQPEISRYSQVHVIVLSDGDHCPGKDPKTSRERISTFSDWTELERISLDLKRRNPNYLTTWYTLGTPEIKAYPNPSSGIETKKAPEATSGFKIAVALPVPKAEFNGDPRKATVGQAVRFYPRSLRGIEQFRWSFSDGQSSTNQDPLVTFRMPSTIDVTLEVAGPGGTDKATKAAFIEVRPLAKPSAAFDVAPKEAFPEHDIAFFPKSDAGAESYRWEFGDGATSTNKQPAHAYRSAGRFDVTLTVSGPGGTDTTTHPGAVAIKERPVDLIVAKFSAGPLKGRAPLRVQFTDRSEGGPVAAYHWDFGDGGSADIKDPSHTYTSAGAFRPKLTVTNTKGKTTVSADEVVITVTPPPPPPRPLTLAEKLGLALLGLFLLWLLVACLVFRNHLSLRKIKGMTFAFGPDRSSPTALHAVYRKHGIQNWIWPRRHATITTATKSKADIRIPTKNPSAHAKPCAKIVRIPFQPKFQIVPAKGGPIQKVSRKKDFQGKEIVTATPLSGPTILAHGDEFDIEGTSCRWQELKQ